MSTPSTSAAAVPPASGRAPLMLEFFRLDRSDVIVPTLAIAIVPTALGPALVFFRLRRVLTEESYVALRSDGLALHKATTETLISWDELTAVRFDEAEKAIVLERRDKDPLLVTDRFAGIDHATLAKRIDDLRRKATFDLLPKS